MLGTHSGFDCRWPRSRPCPAFVLTIRDRSSSNRGGSPRVSCLSHDHRHFRFIRDRDRNVGRSSCFIKPLADARQLLQTGLVDLVGGYDGDPAGHESAQCGRAFAAFEKSELADNGAGTDLGYPAIVLQHLQHAVQEEVQISPDVTLRAEILAGVQALKPGFLLRRA